MNDRDNLFNEDLKGPRVMVPENRFDPVYYIPDLAEAPERN